MSAFNFSNALLSKQSVSIYLNLSSYNKVISKLDLMVLFFLENIEFVECKWLNLLFILLFIMLLFSSINKDPYVCILY